jgi:hypothetical protein
MGYGKMGYWVNGKNRFGAAIKNRLHPYLNPKFQYSTIPLFHD